MCREAFESCMRESGGSICTIAANVRSGFPTMAHTGAARAGVINLTKTLAVEWAPFNVRVNVVSPGIVFTDSATRHYAKATGDTKYMEGYRHTIPARRLGTAEEVAAAVVFLLSPGAQYISGVNLAVDGAQSLTQSTPSGFQEHAGWPEYEGGLDVVSSVPPPPPLDQSAANAKKKSAL